MQCEHCKRRILEGGYCVEENWMGGWIWRFCSKRCIYIWAGFTHDDQD